MNSLPAGVRRFARALVTFKTKREDADYNPLEQFEITSVRKDIEVVESAIEQFDLSDQSARRFFAVFVCVRPRRKNQN